MYSFSKITLFAIILCSVSILVVNSDHPCSDPIIGTNYRSNINLCVYGVRYDGETGKMRPDEKLVVNNAVSWNESNYGIKNFEMAAIPLCHEVEKRQKEGVKNVTLFYGAWVKQNNGTYVSVYMACCYQCLTLSKFQWLGWLMAQYTIRHESTLTSSTYLIYRYRQHYLFQHEFLYRMNVLEGGIGNCIDHFRRIRPITHHNYVCFVAVHDRLNYQSIYARATAPKRKRKMKRVSLGRYNGATVKDLHNVVCNNTISQQADSKCFIHISTNYSYDFECCCYGIQGAHCQDTILNALDGGSGFVRGGKKACAIDLQLHPGIEITRNKYGETYSGTMDRIVKDSVQFEFCEVHLTHRGTTFVSDKAMKLLNGSLEELIDRKSNPKKKPDKKRILRYKQLVHVVTPNSESSTKESVTTGGVQRSESRSRTVRSTAKRTTIAMHTTQNILTTESKDSLIKRHIFLMKSLSCENISTWDPRELDILPFRCVELLPIDAQCPFEPPQDSDSDYLYVKCCCSDGSFCNYEPYFLTNDISKIPQRCKYSNIYQNFVDSHMYPSDPTSPHTCLMHFANYEMLSDIYGQNTDNQNSTRMFTLPGSALSPVDFSYAMLQPGMCKIIDVHVNAPYMLTRHCSNFKAQEELNSYGVGSLPFRIAACRCNTTQTTPCDSDFPVFDPASIRSHMCAKYTEERMAFIEKKLIVNHASPFCVTYVELEFGGTGMHYVVRSNALMRISQFYRLVRIDTLAYIIYATTNAISSNCVAYGKGVICVCHDLDIEPSEDVCNGYSQRIRALRLAIRENVKHSSRQFYKNPLRLARYSESPELCPTTLSFAHLRLTDDNVIIRSGCAHQTSRFFYHASASIFCVEFLVDEECMVHVNNNDETEEEELVCCCTECDLPSIFISELHRRFKNLFELRGQ